MRCRRQPGQTRAADQFAVIKMRPVFALAAAALLALAGCDPMPRAERKAREYCAKQGKEAMVIERKHTGNPLIYQYATVKAACFDPSRVVHTGNAFGVELVAEIDVKGASVLRIAPGSIGDRAGIKYKDVIYEYDRRVIGTVDALRAAVADTPAGSRVSIKLHRDEKEVAISAQF